MAPKSYHNDWNYVAYKLINLPCILLMFIDRKFIHFYSCVMFTIKSIKISLRNWWRMTPITTKAQHNDAGGANTHACSTPTTSEDKGCRFSLHLLRTLSRHGQPHSQLARVELSFPSSSLICALFWTTHVLADPHLCLYPPGLLSGPSLSSPT